MKSVWRLIASIVSVCAFGLAHAGPWAPVGPSDGQYDIATHPTVPGVAMIGGGFGSPSTWFTKDGGTTWVGNPWRGAIERPVLAGVPTVAWMSGSFQMLRSVDEGRSWGIVETDGLGWILDFAVNPSDPNELVVGGVERNEAHE